jgi:hypothetical protein
VAAVVTLVVVSISAAPAAARGGIWVRGVIHPRLDSAARRRGAAARGDTGDRRVAPSERETNR